MDISPRFTGDHQARKTVASGWYARCGERSDMPSIKYHIFVASGICRLCSWYSRPWNWLSSWDFGFASLGSLPCLFVATGKI